VTTLKIKPLRPLRKFYLQALWLSFLPDHALDSMLDARDFLVNPLTYFFFAIFGSLWFKIQSPTSIMYR
jgi:hypothetical protein